MYIYMYMRQLIFLGKSGCLGCAVLLCLLCLLLSSFLLSSLIKTCIYMYIITYIHVHVYNYIYYVHVYVFTFMHKCFLRSQHEQRLEKVEDFISTNTQKLNTQRREHEKLAEEVT